MRRLMLTATLLSGLMVSAAGTAAAGPVRDQFGTSVFGLPWSAGKPAIQAKYPGGTWDKDDKGRDRYCAASRQSLLKLPQTLGCAGEEVHRPLREGPRLVPDRARAVHRPLARRPHRPLVNAFL